MDKKFHKISKGKSIFLLLIWTCCIILSVYFYIMNIKLIHDWWIFVLLWLWVISWITWWIWLYSLNKTQRIKKHKEEMNKISARIAYFNTEWNYGIQDSTWNEINKYYFIAYQGKDFFQSEILTWQLTWWYGNIIDLLKYIDIEYNINDKPQMLEKINNKLDTIAKLEKEAHNWNQTELLINAYNSIKLIKYQLEKAAPYLEIQENKISVWDEITIYINPKNVKEYRIDTDSLLTKD